MGTQPQGLGLVDGIDEAKANTLYGDIRDLLLQEIRDGQSKPWTDRPEVEQWDVIERVDKFSTNLIRKVCAAVAEAEFASIRVLIDSFTVKKGLKIVLTASDTKEAVDALIAGKGAFLVFADPEAYMKARAALGPAPDQPTLDLGEGGDDGPVFDATDAGASVEREVA